MGAAHAAPCVRAAHPVEQIVQSQLREARPSANLISERHPRSMRAVPAPNLEIHAGSEESGDRVGDVGESGTSHISGLSREIAA